MSRIVIGAALSMALLATGACSGSSPSGPSASTTQAASSSTTAFSAQNLNATGVQSGTLSSHDHSEGDGHGRESQLEGAIVSIDAAHRSFVVRTTTVTVASDTIIRHGHTILTFADLSVGEQVHVKGTASGGSIAAREVTVQHEDLGDADRDEASGAVTGLAGTCPAITFTLGSTKVTTSATTNFRHGACAQVANAVVVEVKGVRQPDGSLLASRVSLPHGEDDED